MPDIKALLREIVYFLEPLAEAVEDEHHLVAFFREFGYDLESNSPNAIVQALRESEPSLQDSFSNLVNAAAAGDSLFEVGQESFRALVALSENERVRLAVAQNNQLSQEIFDYLTRRYLGYRIPVAVGALEALGVLVEHEETDRVVPYRSVRFDWSRLGQFITDNGQWASDVYGWGTDFKHQLAIARLVKLVETTQLATTHVRQLTPAERMTFLKQNSGAAVFGADLPLAQEEFDNVTPTGDPIFLKEAGFRVLPFENQTGKLGLAIAPYVMGGVTDNHPITDRLKFKVDVSGQVTGVAAIGLTPEGIEAVGGTAADITYELGLRYESDDPIVLAGDAAGTHLQTKAILLSVGGNLKEDFYVAGGFEELGATIDISNDGFLGFLLPEPIKIKVGTILMGWRNGRGVYFDAGTSLSVIVPLNLPLGPITIYEIMVVLNWENDLIVTIGITADARLGPLYALVEEAGLDLTLKPAPDGDGLLGQHDITFGFKPPTGYGVALEVPAIQGGGYLSVQEHEYRGALALKFETIGFSAFGILTTKLPGGVEGFSLAASIFGEFNLPLGYGFFLTGLGGVIGINRTIDTDALREVLFAGRMDNILFPQDPIGNARTILDDMAAILPAKEGQHLFGPVARIGWGVPTFVEVKLGLVLEVGAEIRILILGGLGCNLPTKSAALIALNLSFFGEIDFAAGTISFDGSLEGSRILTFSVSGDSAIRTGWGASVEHIAAFGGLHPRYPRPAGLPSLRRLSISFGTNNPKITLSAYQAISLTSLQFGAKAELYAKGPKIPFVGQCAAEGQAFFDTLIYFNPFSFTVTLGGGLSLLVDGDVVSGLNFDLCITGPNTFKIDGKVWVTVLGVDVEFPIKHTWGSRQSLPNETASAVDTVRAALKQSKGFEPIAPRGRSISVSFRDAEDVASAIDPLGGLRFVQRAMPLKVRIQKVGEAQVSGARTVDLRVFNGNREISPTEASLDFVRGHFFSLTDSARLRAPAFERHKAGFEFSADELVIDAAGAIEDEYSYEIIKIEVEDDRTATVGIFKHRALTAEFANRFLQATHESQMRPKESLYDLFRPKTSVVLAESGFIKSERFVDAVQLANGPRGRDPFTLLSEAEFVERSVLESRPQLADISDPLVMDSNPMVSNYFAAAPSKR